MKCYFIVVPAVLLSLAGCHSSAPSTQPREPAVTAEVLTVGWSNAGSGATVSGVVHPRIEANIAAQISGPIAAITRHEGEHVHRGEVLVRLHVPSLNAGVAEAQAAVSSAEQQSSLAKVQATLAAETLARYQQLRERHSVTSHELEQMQAQSTAASAQVKIANAQIAVAKEALSVQQANAGNAVLVAPFDGVVTQRMADPGALALPGLPLLQVQSTGETEVQFSVPDIAASTIHLAQRLPITFGQQTQTATVISISPAGDATSHSFMVKATLPKTSLWNSGSVVSIPLPGSASATLSIQVPASSLVEQGGLTGVLVLNESHLAEVRYVTVGPTAEGQVQVLSGLKAGDHVLAHGDLNLAGRSIEVRP